MYVWQIARPDICWALHLTILEIRARICIHLRSAGIYSKESTPPAYVSWRVGTTNRIIVLASQATYVGWRNRFLGIDSRAPSMFYKFGLQLSLPLYVHHLLHMGNSKLLVPMRTPLSPKSQSSSLLVRGLKSLIGRIKSTVKKGWRTGPPIYIGGRPGTTILCRSRLYPPVRD
jgi:hypothetical protein